MKKIGLLIICTNKYIKFLEPLIQTADEFFCKEHDITYFIFTNHDIILNTKRKFKIINVEHREWPWMTLGRYKIFTENSNLFDDYEYLFYCDVDMKFVDEVRDEILSDRVATQHPYQYGKRGAPENNPQSLAYISPNQEMQYFAGGFNGGTKYEFLKMSQEISRNIELDYEKRIIAVWHDESHLNKYFVQNTPTKILNPSYCCHEDWYDCPFGRKLIALNKNHNEVRY